MVSPGTHTSQDSQCRSITIENMLQSSNVEGRSPLNSWSAEFCQQLDVYAIPRIRIRIGSTDAARCLCRRHLSLAPVPRLLPGLVVRLLAHLRLLPGRAWAAHAVRWRLRRVFTLSRRCSSSHPSYRRIVVTVGSCRRFVVCVVSWSWLSTSPSFSFISSLLTCVVVCLRCAPLLVLCRSVFPRARPAAPRGNSTCACWLTMRSAPPGAGPCRSTLFTYRSRVCLCRMCNLVDVLCADPDVPFPQVVLVLAHRVDRLATS